MPIASSTLYAIVHLSGALHWSAQTAADTKPTHFDGKYCKVTAWCCSSFFSAPRGYFSTTNKLTELTTSCSVSNLLVTHIHTHTHNRRTPPLAVWTVFLHRAHYIHFLGTVTGWRKMVSSLSDTGTCTANGCYMSSTPSTPPPQHHHHTHTHIDVHSPGRGSILHLSIFPCCSISWCKKTARPQLSHFSVNSTSFVWVPVIVRPTWMLASISPLGGSFFKFPFQCHGGSYCPGSISMLIGWL